MTQTIITPEMIEAAEEAYMPFGDMGLAIQCALAAAPQPPEAAQSNSAEFDGIKTKAAAVQLPEPAAWVFKDRTWTEIRAMAVDHGGVPAYTEQQVRQLLAAHGIKEQST